jgi:hypothetical protein
MRQRMTVFTAAAVLGLALVGAGTLGAAGPEAEAVPGLQRVLATSVSNSTSPKSALAACPPGTRVIGTGAQITGGLGQVMIDDITPNAALTSVTVTGFEDDDGFTGNWSVTAIAICANPLPGLERVSGSIGPNSNRIKSAEVQCPGTKKLVGSGAQITGGRGQVTLEFLVPSSDFSRTFARAFEDQDGTTANWSLTVYAICANAVLPGQEWFSVGTGFDSVAKGITAGCPSTQVISTGFSLVQGSGQVVLTDLVPNATLTTVHVAAVEDQDGQSGVWSIRSFAICATP